MTRPSLTPKIGSQVLESNAASRDQDVDRRPYPQCVSRQVSFLGQPPSTGLRATCAASTPRRAAKPRSPTTTPTSFPASWPRTRTLRRSRYAISPDSRSGTALTTAPPCLRTDGDVPHPAPRRVLAGHRRENGWRRSAPAAPRPDCALDSAGARAVDADRDPGRGCVRGRGRAAQPPSTHPGGGCADGVCLAHVTGLHHAPGSRGDRGVDRPRGARSPRRPRDRT